MKNESLYELKKHKKPDNQPQERMDRAVHEVIDENPPPEHGFTQGNEDNTTEKGETSSEKIFG